MAITVDANGVVLTPAEIKDLEVKPNLMAPAGGDQPVTTQGAGTKSATVATDQTKAAAARKQ
jgi:hypothetical protein